MTKSVKEYAEWVVAPEEPKSHQTIAHHGLLLRRSPSLGSPASHPRDAIPFHFRQSPKMERGIMEGPHFGLPRRRLTHHLNDP